MCCAEGETSEKIQVQENEPEDPRLPVASSSSHFDLHRDGGRRPSGSKLARSAFQEASPVTDWAAHRLTSSSTDLRCYNDFDRNITCFWDSADEDGECTINASKVTP